MLKRFWKSLIRFSSPRRRSEQTRHDLPRSNIIMKLAHSFASALPLVLTMSLSAATVLSRSLSSRLSRVAALRRIRLSLVKSAMKNNSHRSVAAMTAAFLCFFAHTAASQDWGPTPALSKLWAGVASSSDGVKIVAVAFYDKIYTSTDSGATWTPHESNRQWQAVASSADGVKLVAVVRGGQIYTSTDSGLTWTPRESDRNWSAITSSADGVRLVAGVYNGQLYTSADSGVTWIPRESDRAWAGVASSANGSKLVAVVGAGQIYTSTNFGVSWTPRESNRAWTSVASSADGNHLLACAFLVLDTLPGRLAVSHNSGVTWTSYETTRDWGAVASSADGIKLVAALRRGQIFTSTDSGATWNANIVSEDHWNCVASSASGNKLFAGADSVLGTGRIYVSPSLPPIMVLNGNVTVVWASITGRTYRVQSKFMLTDPMWTDVPGDVFAVGSISAKTFPVANPDSLF
jgi:photosystem II stability/assembly factor-like uncharacterized protein